MSRVIWSLFNIMTRNRFNYRLLTGAHRILISLLFIAMITLAGSALAIQNSANGTAGGVALDVTGATVTLTRNSGADIIAPADITDLSSTARTETSVTLSWTAPGDDGTTGTAGSYDVRYSTSPIDAVTFAAATQATAEPVPSIAGTTESFVVTGLAANTTYYFALVSSDEIPNTSAISNVIIVNTTGAAVTSVLGEIVPNTLPINSVNNMLNYYLLPTVNPANGDSGVNFVSITPPPEVSNMTVTGVAIAGIGGLTENCPAVGNQYCVTMSGTTANIEVGFNVGNAQTMQIALVADANGLPGSYNFTANVDDTATSVAGIQTVASGNADGIAANGNTQNIAIDGLAVSGAIAEVTPVNLGINQTAAFTLSVLPNINAANGDTGVNRLLATVPVGFNNVSVSNVLVGGANTAYADNSTANQIDIQLATQIASNQLIQIQFNATALSSPGSFLFAVWLDDSATSGITAQPATSGDANSIAADSDSLQVQIETATSSAASTVSATPQIVLADGVASSVIDITLLDSNGNPKQGRTVNVTSSRQAAISTETVVQSVTPTDSNGRATASIMSTTPGVTTIYVEDVLDGVTLAQQPQVYFTQGQVLDINLSANKKDVVVGDVVTYFVELRNQSVNDVVNVNLRNALPAHFKFADNSVMLNNSTIAAPVKSARTVTFDLGTIPGLVDSNGNGVADPGETGYVLLSYQLVVGSGVQPGEYKNQVQAIDVCADCYVSNSQEVKVVVDLDPLFGLGTIIGKVFEDKNNDGIQDDGEPGIGNAMVVLDDGTIATTDQYGRYHIPAVKPGQHAIKINLPTINDLAETDLQTRIVDVTPGLLARANFGINYAYEDHKIGRDEQYGVRVSGEQLNQPVQIQGNVKSLSLLVNGKVASFANSSVKLSIDELDDVVVIFGGRLKEPVRFATDTKLGEQIQTWVLDIYDDNNEVIHSLSGAGAPPATIEWDGKSLDDKLLLTQGIYQYQLTLQSQDGTQTSSARRNFGINRQTAVSLNLTGDAFEAGSNRLSAKAKAILHNAAGILKQYPDEVIFVEGHTDNTGSKETNVRLSLDRANAAVSYLVDKENLPRKQFVINGFADQRPIADNSTPEGRELNRRIELKGSVTQVDRAKLLDQYRQRPSVRINNAFVNVDPFGRFVYEAPDEQSGELGVEIAGINGKSLNAQIELPNIEIFDPSNDAVISYGSLNKVMDDEPEEQSESEANSKSDIGYLLYARTEPGNQVLFEGKTQQVRDNGNFYTVLNLNVGSNLFNFVVTNPQGYARVIQLKVLVSDKNEDGSRIVAVTRIPHLTIKLPAKDKKLTSREFNVEGVTEPGNELQINGEITAVKADGSFSRKIKLEKGINLLFISVTDSGGNTGRMSHQIEVVDEEMFLLAFADGKISKLQSSGYLENVNQGQQKKYYTEGRVAYYLRGTVAGKYLIKSAYDSQRQDIDNLFDNLGDEGNEHLIRNIDPDKIYPVYGDGSTLSYDGQNNGKFYLSVQSDELDAIVGSYQLNLDDTELARYQRTLYGAKVAFTSAAKTAYGAPDIKFVVFGAQTRLVHIHDEVRATGGSLYYLSRKDIVEGSEQIAILVRDKDTGLTLSEVTQLQNTDYSINYDLGRVMFNRPISSVSDDSGLFNQSIIAGHPVYVRISYEAESASLENTSTGGYVRKQLGDHVAIGATYVDDQLTTEQYKLEGVDAEIRFGKKSRIVAEVAQSSGSQGVKYVSSDGGLSYTETTSVGAQQGNAWKAAAELDIGEMLDTSFGMNVSGYVKQLEPEFNSISSSSERGSRKTGFNLGVSPTNSDVITLNYHEEKPLDGSLPVAGNSLRENMLTDIQWKHTAGQWSISTGYQERESLYANSEREDNSLGGVELLWKPLSDLTTSIKHQQTLSGQENDQTQLGIGYQVTPALGLDGSVTQGSLGDAAEASINFRTGATRFYLTERVRSDSLTHSTTMVTGAESAVNKSTKVYTEYQREQASQQGTQQDKDVSVVGTRSNWMIGEGFSVRLSSEYGYAESSTNNNNHAAFAIGLTYKHPSGFSLNSRNELRRQWGATDVTQSLTSNSAEVKLDPDYSLLGKLNYSRSVNDDNDQTVAKFTEQSIGLAYRPVNHDVFNALGRFTIIDDQRPVLANQSTIENTRMEVFSIEWAWELNSIVEWVDKEAIRVKRETVGGLPAVETTTFLSVHRLNFRLWKNFDWGVEFRSLRQEEADDERSGWVTEIAWRANRYSRLGFGYNFTDFSDNEFSDNDYSVRGFYLRLQAIY